MSAVDDEKRAAAEAAAELVEDGARGVLEAAALGGVGRAQAALALLPLEQRVLDRVRHAVTVAAAPGAVSGSR